MQLYTTEQFSVKRHWGSLASHHWYVPTSPIVRLNVSRSAHFLDRNSGIIWLVRPPLHVRISSLQSPYINVLPTVRRWVCAWRLVVGGPGLSSSKYDNPKTARHHFLEGKQRTIIPSVLNKQSRPPFSAKYAHRITRMSLSSHTHTATMPPFLSPLTTHERKAAKTTSYRHKVGTVGHRRPGTSRRRISRTLDHGLARKGTSLTRQTRPSQPPRTPPPSAQTS